MSIVLIIMLGVKPGVTHLFGGPKDKPIIWRGGGNYHLVSNEVYWKEVFREHGLGNFQYNNAPGGYANIDFVLARFEAVEKHRYSTKTHSHLEFARKTQAFLTPKGLYLGYVVELYTLVGNVNANTVSARITTPGGICIGVFSGTLPAYPYLSLSVGASFVSERWRLPDWRIEHPPKEGNIESTGFWGLFRGGLLYQIRAHFAIDFSITYSFLSLRHRTGEPVPTTKDERDTESIQEYKIGLGLIFAMPWQVEKTIW